MSSEIEALRRGIEELRTELRLALANSTITAHPIHRLDELARTVASINSRIRVLEQFRDSIEAAFHYSIDPGIVEDARQLRLPIEGN